MRWRKHPSALLRAWLRTGLEHARVRLREWLARWLGVGRAQRLRARTRAEVLAAAYRHKLVAELHNLKILDAARPFDLETSYIPLRVRGYNGRGEFTGHVGEGEALVRKGSGRAPCLSGSMFPEEALVRFHHLAVLGDPGAGKTTMLRHLTLLAAQGRLENLPDFPILVPLGHFAVVPQLNLLDFVINEIETGCSFPEPRPYLEERLEGGSVLFLLDGLDEANVGRPQEAEDTYRHVVGQINVLAARYPNCPIVVTARRKGWKGLLAASFHTVELLGFNRACPEFRPEPAEGPRRRDNIQHFIVKWFDTTDRAQGLQGALSQNPRMWALAANPLLLSLMAFVFEQDGELPEGRAGLYERGVELLLDTADRENVTDTEHKRNLLEEVALHFHLRRVLLFPEDELREVVTGLEEISDQHSLLREQMGGWYGFPHSTWQEYFAAAAISKRGRVENGKWRVEIGEWRIEESLHDPWWEGTALFLAGILEDATPFLESILAQEEDIFYSNLLLAGRCLADLSRIEGPVGDGSTELAKVLCRPEGIVKELKRLVEGGYHRLLQRQAVSVLAEIGGEKGRFVVPDLLAFLTDEKLDPFVRGNIAEALGSLGDESVIPPLLALLPDETVDPSVRGRVVEALLTLGGESIVSLLLALLPDEGIDPYVRERISGAVILYPPVVSQFLALLPDEKIAPSVRRGIAEAVGSLGDQSVVPNLLALLSDEKVDPSVRGKAAEALGALGAESVVPPLLVTLSDEKVNYSVRMTVAEALGVLGDESVASRLLALLPDEKIDPDVRASIAGALGVLGDKTMVPQLLSLLPDERIDPPVRWRIVDALSSLGDRTIIPHLRALLPNEEIDSSVRWTVAEALEALVGEREKGREIKEIGDWRSGETLGPLDDRSRVPRLLALLKDEKIDPSVSGKIIEALGSLGDDRDTVEGLAALLDREDIGSRVYKALFQVSQRAGMRVFVRKDGGYEVRPLESV